MPFRKMIAKIGDKAKNNSLTNSVFRNNVFYYQRSLTKIKKIRNNPQNSEALIAELLQRSLSWAAQTSYGTSYGSDLQNWPVLSKAEVLSAPSKFRRRFQLSAPAATGGSSGQPLRLWRSMECIAAEQATIDSLLGPGVPPMLEQKVVILRADYVKDPADSNPPFGIVQNSGRWLNLSNAHLTRTNLPWFVDAIKAFKPTMLWVYPTALLNLLRLADEAGARMSIPLVLSSSEMISDSLYRFTEKSLGARVIDRYGQGERVCSAHATTIGEYRFDPSYGYTELVPDTDSEDGSSQATARIIATGYWNSAFPLIRYDTGDRAIVPDSNDADSLKLIASGLLPFQGIIGRSDDYLYGQDGERITGMNHIPRELDDVLRVQIIQSKSDEVRILALSKGTLSQKDRDTLEKNARELVPPYMKLQIESAPELHVLPNGKTPFIIRELDESLSRDYS